MRIRPAEPTDLPLLQGIETRADGLLCDWFGVEPPALDGPDRAAVPGFLLVASDQLRTVGFVDVTEEHGRPDRAHLEQLSVLPDFARRGIGTAPVRAAGGQADRLGFTTLTLRTFAEVPFNAPFYSRLGFEVVDEASDFDGALILAEARLGLDRVGRRVLMRARTAAVGASS